MINDVPSTEELIEFILQLRQLDFEIGTRECIAAKDLLIALSARDEWPEPDRLSTYLAPVFCTSADEQERFYRQFELWLGRRRAENKNGDPNAPSEESTAAGATLARSRVSKTWDRIRFNRFRLVALAVAVIIAISVIVLLSLRVRTSTHKLSGSVTDNTSGAAIAGATVSYADRTITSDERGHFLLVYPSTAGLAKVSVTHPRYISAESALSTGQDNSIEVSLTPLRGPETSASDKRGPRNDLVKEQRSRQTPVVPFAKDTSQESSRILIPPPPPSWWRSFYQRHFKFAQWSVILLPLFLLVLWNLWRLRRRHQLEKWRRKELPESSKLLIDGASQSAFHDPAFRRVAQELRRHSLAESTELDAEATIAATIGRGGMFTPIYGSRKKVPEYLILINRISAGDQEARFEDETVDHLEREGLLVNRYYFHADPRICRAATGGSSITLEDSAARHPDDYLIIFSESEYFFDLLSGRPSVWMDQFSTWKGRALLTPGLPHSHHQSALKDLGFNVLPSSKAGLEALAEIIRTGAQRKRLASQTARRFPELIARARPDRWIAEDRPGATDLNRLRAQLRNYLGNGGFDWLCACAVYPALAWDLTLYIGDVLGRRSTTGVVPQEEDLLGALVRLPWFRAGVMPDWFRSKLITAMPRVQEIKVRDSLQRLLLTSLEKAHEGVPLEIVAESHDQTAWQKLWLRLKKQVRKWQRQRFLRDFLRTESRDSPLQDYVFLTFLSGNRLALALPRQLRSVLFRDGRSINGLQPGTAFMFAVIASLLSLTTVSRFPPDATQNAADRAAATSTPTATTAASPTPQPSATLNMADILARSLTPPPLFGPETGSNSAPGASPEAPSASPHDAASPSTADTSRDTSSTIIPSLPIDPLEANLSEEDMALIAADQPPETQKKLKSDDSARRDFAKNVRELLAVAAEARKSGVADQPEVQRQLDLVRMIVISQSYFQSYAGGKPNITDAEIDELFKQPGVQTLFDQFIKDAKASNPTLTQDIPSGQLAEVRRQYGQVIIGAQKGINAGLSNSRQLQIQILLESARLVASTYAKEQLLPNLKATDAEIETYVAAHPELDPAPARQKAETVLQRVREGVDFAKLAKEFSTDPGSKDKGGDLGWFKRGQMVEEFEKAAFGLAVGQTSGIVETAFGFHIIKLEGRHFSNEGGKRVEEIHARHILISYPGPTNGVGASKSPRDQAREAIENEKEKRLIDEIVRRSRIAVPENFKIKQP